jgi:hypothetical protein
MPQGDGSQYPILPITFSIIVFCYLISLVISILVDYLYDFYLIKISRVDEKELIVRRLKSDLKRMKTFFQPNKLEQFDPDTARKRLTIVRKYYGESQILKNEQTEITKNGNESKSIVTSQEESDKKSKRENEVKTPEKNTTQKSECKPEVHKNTEPRVNSEEKSVDTQKVKIKGVQKSLNKELFEKLINEHVNNENEKAKDKNTTKSENENLESKKPVNKFQSEKKSPEKINHGIEPTLKTEKRDELELKDAKAGIDNSKKEKTDRIEKVQTIKEVPRKESDQVKNNRKDSAENKPVSAKEPKKVQANSEQTKTEAEIINGNKKNQETHESNTKRDSREPEDRKSFSREKTNVSDKKLFIMKPKTKPENKSAENSNSRPADESVKVESETEEIKFEKQDEKNEKKIRDEKKSEANKNTSSESNANNTNLKEDNGQTKKSSTSDKNKKSSFDRSKSVVSSDHKTRETSMKVLDLEAERDEGLVASISESIFSDNLSESEQNKTDNQKKTTKETAVSSKQPRSSKNPDLGEYFKEDNPYMQKLAANYRIKNKKLLEAKREMLKKEKKPAFYFN